MNSKYHWMDIPGHPGYSVSSRGRVRQNFDTLKIRAGSILKLHPKSGYLQACLNGGEQGQIQVRVHRLVMLAFVGPCPAGMEVNHKDGIRTNNRLSNLEYITHKQNMHHAIRMGLSNRPTPRKLATEKIIELAGKYSRKEATQHELSLEYKVSESSVRRYLKRFSKGAYQYAWS